FVHQVLDHLVETLLRAGIDVEIDEQGASQTRQRLDLPAEGARVADLHGSSAPWGGPAQSFPTDRLARVHAPYPSRGRGGGLVKRGAPHQRGAPSLPRRYRGLRRPVTPRGPVE